MEEPALAAEDLRVSRRYQPSVADTSHQVSYLRISLLRATHGMAPPSAAAARAAKEARWRRMDEAEARHTKNVQAAAGHLTLPHYHTNVAAPIRATAVAPESKTASR
jgi:hypothetical protein